MPFINASTNVTISQDKETVLKSKFGQAISIIPGKSESWLMVKIEDNCKMYFQGSDEPCIFVNVKIFGNASDSALESMTAELTNIISDELAIAKNRVYVQYELCSHWGWNGGNF